MLNEELDEYNLSDRMKDFEDNPVGGNSVKIETTTLVKQEDVPMNNLKDSEQKVKKWLKTVSPKEEETDEEKENAFAWQRENGGFLTVCPFKVSNDDFTDRLHSLNLTYQYWMEILVRGQTGMAC